MWSSMCHAKDEKSIPMYSQGLCACAHAGASERHIDGCQRSASSQCQVALADEYQPLQAASPRLPSVPQAPTRQPQARVTANCLSIQQVNT